jgi:ribonuclease T1
MLQKPVAHGWGRIPNMVRTSRYSRYGLRRRRDILVWLAGLTVALLFCGNGAFAYRHDSASYTTYGSADTANGQPANAQAVPPIPVSALPPEAVRTLQLIRQGGPFPYEKDGVVFGNYERLLPHARRGFYHEYTVPPAAPPARPRWMDWFARPAKPAHNRGVRRIVCGGRAAKQVCYYTSDHYNSFKRIVE